MLWPPALFLLKDYIVSNDLHPPVEGVTDEPTEAVALNERWWGYIQGLLFPALQPGYWASDGQRGSDSILDILDLIARGNVVVTDQKYVRVRRTISQSIPNNVPTQITFNNVLKDTHGLWSAGAPNVIAIDEPGLWHVGAQIWWDNNTIGWRMHVLNSPDVGNIARSTKWPGAGTTHDTFSTKYPFAAPTTIWFAVMQNSGANRSVVPLPEHSIDFWAHFLGPLP